jgi:hypothetical protein
MVSLYNKEEVSVHKLKVSKEINKFQLKEPTEPKVTYSQRAYQSF